VRRCFALAVVVTGCYRDVTGPARMDAQIPPSGCIDTSFLSGSDDPNRALWQFDDVSDLTGSGWNAPPNAALYFYTPAVARTVSMTLVASSVPAGVHFSVGSDGDSGTYTLSATNSFAQFGSGGFDGAVAAGASVFGSVGAPIDVVLAGSSGQVDYTFTIEGKTPIPGNLVVGSGSAAGVAVIDPGSAGALISDVQICF
jgi:hypothetical protein